MGAYDHALFRKVTEELDAQTETPFLKVLLTLSSHEPFDVPMRRFENRYLNSVAYTDSCLGVFVSDLKKANGGTIPWLCCFLTMLTVIRIR